MVSYSNFLVMLLVYSLVSDTKMSQINSFCLYSLVTHNRSQHPYKNHLKAMLECILVEIYTPSPFIDLQRRFRDTVDHDRHCNRSTIWVQLNKYPL